MSDISWQLLIAMYQALCHHLQVARLDQNISEKVSNAHNNAVRKLDKSTAIQTNLVEKGVYGQPSCLLVGLVNIYYFDQFNVSFTTGEVTTKELFDGAFVLMNESFFNKSYVKR